MSDSEILKAPFPWFGGKSRVAPLVWDAFGTVNNYVEPFFGSGAVLLGRIGESFGTETVNDLDCYLSNFWRSIRHAPEETAQHANWPVNEADLLARHNWLVSTGAARIAHLRSDPDFFDAKVAGWWVWGLCAWIGSGWCVQRGNGHQPEQLPHLGNAGMGINLNNFHTLATREWASTGNFHTLATREWASTGNFHTLATREGEKASSNIFFLFLLACGTSAWPVANGTGFLATLLQ